MNDIDDKILLIVTNYIDDKIVLDSDLCKGIKALFHHGVCADCAHYYDCEIHQISPELDYRTYYCADFHQRGDYE